ncbi:hypothetical protein BWI17_09005 [Betaproteobacteria bacterium GR16-43]|nr:hypothetical protein BWI17_09005 [Betaproteobacteria bacterium GR16-43]
MPIGTLRRYFIAGLLVWIPLGITLWLLKLAVDVMDQSLLLLPDGVTTEALFGFHVPGLGIILTLAILLVTGAFAANFFGRKLLSLGDAAVSRIPIVRSIYGGVKQISDTLFSSEGQAFRRAVLVRYPHAGSWTVALVTGTPRHEVTDHVGHDQVGVFVPTTPNITAGFFLIVPRAETIELEMSVDDALKYIISMGVAEPPRRNRPESESSGTDPDPRPSPTK